MGRYMERLKAKKRLVSDPPELTKPTPSVVATANTTNETGFVGFDGARGRGFPKIWGRYGRVFAALESRCPEEVPAARWRQAIEDDRRFLGRWGEQAEALGWTAKDLLGLHQPPDKPHPSYSRLSRYDETGLIWLLHGRKVVALTEATAAIESSTGAVMVYRRFNKPALGPLGDSVADLEPPFGGSAA
jgi:hypothetical protein